jgi:hypothetical protein
VFWTFRRFDLKSSIINDYRWLSKAKSILSPEPKCLSFIHRSARSIVSNKIKLTSIELEKLTVARRGALGSYFEMLIGTLFSISPEIESTYTNVVVRDGKTTAGEFDLLFKKSGHWHHLELTIKFYIGTSDKTSGFNWHGPAMRDSLGRKCSRINEHQLKLSKLPAASETLRNFSINSIESEALMLGRLFYPFTDWVSNSLVFPSNVSRSHTNGWWMYASNLCSLSKTTQLCYLPLMKYDWMAETEMQSPPSKIKFKGIRHPQMVAVFKQGEQNKFYEIQRGFIVPNDWGPI